jgi:hypothetical protein
MPCIFVWKSDIHCRSRNGIKGDAKTASRVMPKRHHPWCQNGLAIDAKNGLATDAKTGLATDAKNGIMSDAKNGIMGDAKNGIATDAKNCIMSDAKNVSWRRASEKSC